MMGGGQGQVGDAWGESGKGGGVAGGRHALQKGEAVGRIEKPKQEEGSLLSAESTRPPSGKMVERRVPSKLEGGGNVKKCELGGRVRRSPAKWLGEHEGESQTVRSTGLRE